MTIRASLVFVAAGLTLGACSMFEPKPAVEMTTADVNLNARWHANIASPAELAGVVQMSGSASLAPGAKRGTTGAVLNLANSPPGGVHPWAIHMGQCGADQGVFGSLDNYQPLRVNSDGTGSSSAIVAQDTPTTGSYYASVQASGANNEVIIACGNLAAPTQ